MNLAGLPGMVNAGRPTGPTNLGRSWAQIIPGVHHKNRKLHGKIGPLKIDR